MSDGATEMYHEERMGIDSITPAEWDAMRRTFMDRQKGEPEKEIDMVNSPPHYTFSKFETIDVLEEWFRHEPLLWQVGKYISRWNRKGDPVENLEKAAYYLNRKIAQLKVEVDHE